VAVPAAGGTTVTITGANLSGATAVMIAGISSGFTVMSDTLITATAPAHAPGGMFDVAVTTPAGTYPAVGAIAYWQAPAWPCTVLEVAPDPAVVYNPTLRTAILRTGLPWRITESALGIEMVLIPNGTFWMGCSASNQYACFSDETPNHWVTLTQPFYLGRYEVTQAQWKARTGSNPSNFQNASAQVPADQVPNRPVDYVSWNAIVNDFQPGTGLRLPTEAEWEWACRAGTTTAFHGWPAQPNGTNDDTTLGNIAWYDTNANSQTHPVGQLQPNGFGLYDMSGNVWEWLADAYDSNYYSHSPSVDPPGGTSGFLNNERVLRGGSWYNVTGGARSSCRDKHAPGITYNNYGFRVARTP
jgi:formylglycine-generating enzyme required for sulfatase activity